MAVDPMRGLDLPGRQCRARNRRGEQCKRAAIPGGNVCRYHGGAAPQVLEAARRRLASFVLDSLDVVEEGLRGEDRHGVLIPYAARLKTATEVLDRVGIVAHRGEQLVRHEVEGSVSHELGPAILRALEETRQLASEHRARALELGNGARAESREVRASGATGDAGHLNVVDVEVVEPAPAPLGELGED